MDSTQHNRRQCSIVQKCRRGKLAQGSWCGVYPHGGEGYCCYVGTQFDETIRPVSFSSTSTRDGDGLGATATTIGLVSSTAGLFGRSLDSDLCNSNDEELIMGGRGSGCSSRTVDQKKFFLGHFFC